jgi:hypothetical protein
MLSPPTLQGVFPCPGGEKTCLKKSENQVFVDIPAMPCGAGSDGPLCSNCAEDWSRSGLQGECSECSDELSMAWIVAAGVISIVLAVLVLHFVSGFSASNAKMHTIQVLGKIAITLIQILSQLGVALQLTWPPVFLWVLSWFKLFSFGANVAMPRTRARASVCVHMPC